MTIKELIATAPELPCCKEARSGMWLNGKFDPPFCPAHSPRTPTPVDSVESRFWLVLQEPGRVPERKGSWPLSGMASTLREFMAARPTAYIHVLTVGHDGTPEVQHGPEALQMLDGRSLGVGRKHNARVREAERLAALTDTGEEPSEAMIDAGFGAYLTTSHDGGERPWIRAIYLAMRAALSPKAGPDIGGE